MPLQNMLFWHVDYFELKALVKQQIQEKYCDHFSSFLTAGDVILMWKMSSLFQKKRNIIIKNEKLKLREFYTYNSC